MVLKYNTKQSDGQAKPRSCFEALILLTYRCLARLPASQTPPISSLQHVEDSWAHSRESRHEQQQQPPTHHWFHT